MLADANDCTPTFVLAGAGGQYTFEVSEGALVGSRVGSVHATDCDVGANAALEYVLGAPLLPPELPPAGVARRATYSASAFELSAAGELTLKRPLDREDVEEYRFAVLAVDQGVHCASALHLHLHFHLHLHLHSPHDHRTRPR